MNKNKHLFYFDYLRIFACLCVIFMHTASSSLANVGGMGWEALNVITSLAFCAVPLFFMMSGYLLLSSKNTYDIKKLFVHRLPRLLVPLSVWSVIAAAWLSYGNGDFDFIGFAKKSVFAIGTPVMPHFWFMYTLIAMYLISPFLAKAIQSMNKTSHIMLFAICAVSVLVTGLCNVLPYDIYSNLIPSSLRQLKFFNGHLPTFILGYYIGSFGKKIPNFIPLALLFVTTAFVAYMTSLKSNNAASYIQDFQCQNGIFEVIVAVCIFVLAKQLINSPAGIFTKAVSTISTLSFPIYLMHNVALSIFERTGIFGGGTIKTLLFTLIIFAICSVFLKIVSSVKGICYIFCGVSYDNACKSCNLQYSFSKVKK